MAVGFNYLTDLYNLYFVVQNTMLRYPKDLIISSLKEFFSHDSKYHYVSDSWGYSLTNDHTGLPLDAGMYNDLTTRIWIGEKNRFDIIHYPSIAVSAGSFRYVPISMNRDQYVVEYKVQEFIDGYGHRAFTSVPEKFVSAGAWEGSISIEISSDTLRERDDLIELVSLYLTHLNWNNLSRAGVSIKPDLSVGSPTESEDRNNKLFKQSININIRGEWSTEIPIDTIIDVINFCVEFGHFTEDSFFPAPNIQINTNIELQDQLFDENLRPLEENPFIIP